MTVIHEIHRIDTYQYNGYMFSLKSIEPNNYNLFRIRIRDPIDFGLNFAQKLKIYDKTYNYGSCFVFELEMGFDGDGFYYVRKVFSKKSLTSLKTILHYIFNNCFIEYKKSYLMERQLTNFITNLFSQIQKYLFTDYFNVIFY